MEEVAMSSVYKILTTICVACGLGSSELYLQGTVENSFGEPIANAQVAYSGGGQVTTDENGAFLITGDGGVRIKRGISAIRRSSVRLIGSRIVLANVEGKFVAVDLFDPRGRRIALLHEQRARENTMHVGLGKQRLAAGSYIVSFVIGEQTFRAPITLVGGRLLSTDREFFAGAQPGALARAAAGNLTASATGYNQRQFEINADTAVNLILTLFQSGIESIPQAVTVSENFETRAFRVRTPTGKGTTYSWSGTWFEQYNNLDYSNNDTKDVRYNVIHLDNGLIRVTVSPDLGMRVIRAEDKVTGEARSLFAVLDDPANGVNPAWQDIGGVEPSFPFYEAGVASINDEGNLCSKSGYYIDRQPDGTVRVIMNRRSDHHQDPKDIAFLGRYGDRPLIGVVTLRPGQSSFSVTYIGQNPNPLRRSNRIWNDALFPYEDDEKILFPFKYAMRHGAYGGLIDLHEEFPDGITNYINPWDGNASYFGFNAEYPFAGVYYPQSDANHLRITDPERNPGYKLYVGLTNFTELWGSTNPVFEAPDTFVNAFETVAMEHSFYMVRGIGEIAFANEYVAIATTADNAFLMTAPSAAIVDIYEYNESNSPILSQEEIGPGIVLSGNFSEGLRVVANGNELCNIRLPLVFSTDTSSVDRIREMAHRSGGWTDGSGQPHDRVASKATLDARRMFNYELEGPQNHSWMLSSLGALIAVDNVSAQDDADVLISMANTAYRYGAFGANDNSVVEQYLGLIGGRRPQDSRYLHALMKLELGQEADFSNTPIEGAYFRALAHIAEDKISDAINELDALIAQRPRAVRPRLVRAYCTKNLHDALHCLELAPGAIECWAVLKHIGYPGAEANLNSLLDQEGSGSIRLEDFIAECTSGRWRHERRIEYVSGGNQSWFRKRNGTVEQTLPPFPERLTY